MKDIVISIPDSLKLQLDQKRAEGYTITGFTRAALERALAAEGPKGKRATPKGR